MNTAVTIVLITPVLLMRVPPIKFINGARIPSKPEAKRILRNLLRLESSHIVPAQVGHPWNLVHCVFNANRNGKKNNHTQK